jgi:hypothetical protein
VNVSVPISAFVVTSRAVTLIRFTLAATPAVSVMAVVQVALSGRLALPEAVATIGDGTAVTVMTERVAGVGVGTGVDGVEGESLPPQQGKNSTDNSTATAVRFNFMAWPPVERSWSADYLKT